MLVTCGTLGLFDRSARAGPSSGLLAFALIQSLLKVAPKRLRSEMFTTLINERRQSGHSGCHFDSPGFDVDTVPNPLFRSSQKYPAPLLLSPVMLRRLLGSVIQVIDIPDGWASGSGGGHADERNTERTRQLASNLAKSLLSAICQRLRTRRGGKPPSPADIAACSWAAAHLLAYSSSRAEEQGATAHQASPADALSSVRRELLPAIAAAGGEGFASRHDRWTPRLLADTLWALGTAFGAPSAAASASDIATVFSALMPAANASLLRRCQPDELVELVWGAKRLLTRMELQVRVEPVQEGTAILMPLTSSGRSAEVHASLVESVAEVLLMPATITSRGSMKHLGMSEVEEARGSLQQLSGNQLATLLWSIARSTAAVAEARGGVDRGSSATVRLVDDVLREVMERLPPMTKAAAKGASASPEGNDKSQDQISDVISSAIAAGLREKLLLSTDVSSPTPAADSSELSFIKLAAGSPRAAAVVDAISLFLSRQFSSRLPGEASKTSAARMRESDTGRGRDELRDHNRRACSSDNIFSLLSSKDQAVVTWTCMHVLRLDPENHPLMQRLRMACDGAGEVWSRAAASGAMEVSLAQQLSTKNQARRFAEYLPGNSAD